MSDQENVQNSCRLTIWLFGKPAWELELEGAEVDAALLDEVSKLGDQLRERLLHVSATTKLLIENGWSGSGGLYDIWLNKDIGMEDARVELARLGIDSDEVNLEEEEMDEE